MSAPEIISEIIPRGSRICILEMGGERVYGSGRK